MSKKRPSVPFDATRREVLQDAQAAAAYLEECLTDGDTELFTEALRHVADARLGGMGALADQTHLARETLYRTLSKRGNPRLDTLTKVLGAMGLRMTIAADAGASNPVR
jgi:probable addiction module antidote protein